MWGRPRWRTWHAGLVSEVMGTAVVVVGGETLLSDRAVAARIAAGRRQVHGVEVAEVEAGELEGNRLAELTGGSLFAPATIAVIRDVATLPGDLNDALIAVAKDPGPDLALILVHPGGVKGKALLDALKKVGVERIDAAPIKAWEVPKFVQTEARRHRLSLDDLAAQALVDAVGTDLRALVSGLNQLASDAAGAPITAEFVTRYFAGRAEVTSFAVADEVLRRRLAEAMEKLRWALGCGVAPVLITSALAGQFRALGKYHDLRSARLSDAEVARQIEVPPWKIKDLARQSRVWSATEVSQAVRRIAQADAEVKGAASDPDFALEQMTLDLVRLGG